MRWCVVVVVIVSMALYSMLVGQKMLYNAIGRICMSAVLNSKTHDDAGNNKNTCKHRQTARERETA